MRQSLESPHGSHRYIGSLRRPIPPINVPSVEPPAPAVFIVDNDPAVRAALGTLFRYTGWRVIALPLTGPFLVRPNELVPSCLVLDVSLLDLAQEHLIAEYPGTQMVCLTGAADIPMTVRAMRAGAIDVLVKPVDAPPLLEAVGRALQHSEALMQQSTELRQLQECYAMLSHRERQVMALVVRGLMNKQVAGTLGISEITVKAHRGRVMRKMGSRSLAGLVQMAAQLQLVRPDETH